MTDVDSEHIFGEGPPGGVGAEDADRESDLFSCLPALTHNAPTIPFRCKREWNSRMTDVNRGGNACQVTDESTESRMRRGKRCKGLRPEFLSIYGWQVKCLWHSTLGESMRHFNCTLPQAVPGTT